MNPRTLLALCLLLGILGGLSWWQLQRERAGAFTLDVPLFEDVARGDITAFRIDNLERSVQVHLERREGEWWVVDPLAVRADEGVIERLFEIVERNRGLLVPREEADAARLGLEPPRAIFDVLVQRADGVERQRVEIGRRDLDGRSLFVRSRGHLLRTLQNLDTQIDKEVHDYRSRRIVEIPARSVIEVHRVGSYQPDLEHDPIDMNLSAVREGATWRLLRPYEAALDPLAVAVLVDGTSRLWVEQFIEDAAPDVARYGLDRPQLSIELVASGGQRNTVHLTRPGRTSDWLVTREDRGTVWSIAPEEVPPLLIPVEAMFDSLLLRLAREEIDALRLESPERELRLERGRRGWTVAEARPLGGELGPPRPADARAVDGLLGQLEGAELIAFLPDLGFPTETPRLGVHVEARGFAFGGRLGPETTDAEGEPAYLFQRRGDDVVALVGPWLDELARTPVAELLDPRLLAVEEIYLAGLRLERPGSEARFTRDERGFWRRAGDAAEALELLPLLDPLLFLRADEHLDPASAAPLEAPLTVVFERTDGGEIAFRVGLGSAAGGGLRAEAEVHGARAVLREEDLHRRLLDLLP